MRKTTQRRGTTPGATRWACCFATATLALGCSPAVFESLGEFESELNACGMTPAELEASPDKLPGLLKQTNASKARLLTKNLAAPWSSSRELAVDGDVIVVADRDNGDVVFMNRKDMSVTKKLHVGGGPDHLLVGPDGEVWVTLRWAAKVIRIADQKVDMERPTGAEPIGIAMSPDGQFVFVASAAENHLQVLDAKSGAKLLQKTVGERPRTISVSHGIGTTVRVVVGYQNPFVAPGSKLSTVSTGASTLEYDNAHVSSSKYDGKASFSFMTTTPRSIALRAANPGHGPVTNSTLRVKQGRTGLQAVRVSGSAVDPETGNVVISHMLAAPGNEQSSSDQAFGESKKSGSVGSYGSGGHSGQKCESTPIRPMEPALSTVGNKAVASGRAQDTEVEFAVRHMETGRSMLAIFDQPAGISFHPKATLAFMPSQGTDNVLVLNTGDGDLMKNPIAELKVGQAPVAVAFSEDGHKAYVLNGFDWTVTELDLTALLTNAVVNASSYKGLDSGHLKPAAPQLAQPLTISATEKLHRTAKFGDDPLPESLRLGRRMFHWTANPKLAKSGRFACASCHYEGSQDKLVWHIVDGPRQTPSLAGRLQGTGPFNWMGTEHALQNNMDKTIERMGGKGLNAAELSSLEQFMLNGLHEAPNPHRLAEGLSTDQAAGKKLFFDPEVGCANCHAGAEGTDGKLWDVGTATALERQIAKVNYGQKTMKFNTPSLRGVWSTAPYLHDGSASTLMDVLKRTEGKMGNVKHLSTKQKQQLIAYMKTL